MGDFTVDQLPATGYKTADYSNMTLTVNCSAPTKISVAITDNRSDSIDDSATTGSPKSRMGLGFAPGNIKIGAWALAVRSGVTIDGAAASTTVGTDTIYWTTNSGTPDPIIPTTPGGTEAVAGTNFVIPLSAEVRISSQLRSVEEQVDVDGNTTLSLTYL